MLRIIIILAFSLSCNNELLFRLNIAYAKSFSMGAFQQQQSEGTVVDKPYFVENPRNITALHNDSVTLKCTVRNKANRTVSWIRKRDLAILTSNTSVYTSDARFSVIHIPDSHNWDLRIKTVTKRDQGLYECQCNTEPKINFPVSLEVLNDAEALSEGRYKIINKYDGKVPRAKIVSSSPVLEVAKGSTISLTCTVNLQASLILWYHNSTIVDYQRGGMNLENEKSSEGITSRLMLTKANFRDSGNYSCSAQTIAAASSMSTQFSSSLMSLSSSSSLSSSTPPTPSTSLTILPDSITVHVIDL